MGETCGVCGREKWEYFGPARKPTNCMQDYDWCPDDNAAQHWRRGYERSQAALAAARRECEGLRTLLTEAREFVFMQAARNPVKHNRDTLRRIDAALAAPAAGEEGKRER